MTDQAKSPAVKGGQGRTAGEHIEAAEVSLWLLKVGMWISLGILIVSFL